MNKNNLEIINIDNIDSFNKLDEFKADNNVRAIVLELADEFIIDASNKYLIEQIKHFPIPIISNIKTDVKGFMFEIVLASHLCFVSDTVKFEISDKEKVKKQIGTANAAKLNSFEKEIDAKTALDLGLINGVTSVKDLDEEVFGIAKKIAQLAPIAIKSCLEAVNKGSEMDLNDGLELEMKLFSRIFATEDMIEGTSAFLEKRKPIFKGE